MVPEHDPVKDSTASASSRIILNSIRLLLSAKPSKHFRWTAACTRNSERTFPEKVTRKTPEQISPTIVPRAPRSLRKGFECPREF